jgi:carbon-monoxide dehydrogenase medium subunit
MFPAEFDYRRPETVDDAVALLSDDADAQVEVLAGGHSLLPMMKSGLAHPDVVVDIGRIDALRGIDAGDDVTTVGATATYTDLLRSASLATAAPALAATLDHVGDPQVRNRGTLGGSLANADPAADPPAAFLVADGRVVARGPDGERTIDAEEFFVGMYTTTLADDELLVRMEIPHSEARVRGAYAKRASPSSGYAVVGVAVHLELDDDHVMEARIAANGMDDYPVRLSSVEEALVDGPLTAEAADDAAARATDDVDREFVMDDSDASPEFRCELLTVYTERALHDVLGRI